MRLLALLLTPFLASAGDPTYELIAPIGTLPEKVTLETYLSGMYTTVIGIAGILAVLMLVICGIKLMGSGGAQGKSEARQCVTNAILGLLLAIGSWILLYTINPQLVGTSAKLAVGVPSAPPAAEKIVSTTTFVPNARTDGFSCTASDTIGCVTTNFPIERIIPFTYTPTPEKVTAFGFSTPGAGAFKGTITATAADLATMGKLLIISEIAGDTATFGKYPACVAQGDDTSIIKYSMDPTSDPDTYCILKPDTRYYINVVNLEKGTTNPTCTDVASCTFSLWTNNEKVAVVTGGGGSCAVVKPVPCLSSGNLVCVNTPSFAEGTMRLEYTPSPSAVYAFKVVSPATLFTGSVSATVMTASMSAKLLVVSRQPGDMTLAGKDKGCIVQGTESSHMNFTNDPARSKDVYCYLEPGSTYYVNASSGSKSGGISCTTPSNCGFYFQIFAGQPTTTLAPVTATCVNGTTCTLRDPGKGLWSPDVNAAVPVYVVDQSTKNGEPATWTGISGCVNGGSVDSYEASCLTSVYTGKIDGKTVTISSRPGYILSIRYFVDHKKTLDKSNGSFQLESLIGGNIGGAGVKMTLTPIPGDMSPANARCATETTMAPSISVGNGPFGCSVDMTRDIYYLNIQFKGNYSIPLSLDEGVTLFHPGTVTLPNGQCLKTGGVTAPITCVSKGNLVCKETPLPIATQNRIEIKPSSNKTVYAFKMARTPSSGGLFVRAIATGMTGARSSKLLVVSKVPGDVSTEGKDLGCYRLSAESTSIQLVTNSPDVNKWVYCPLDPNTVYYINAASLDFDGNYTCDPSDPDRGNCNFYFEGA